MPHGPNSNQRGFTIQELLIVVAISVILLAVSAVGIVTYMRHLQLTELDNAAKEIFLAAQNRAILLSGGHRLEQYVVQSDGGNRLEHVDVIPGSDETTQITAYYIHSSDLLDEASTLLPQDTIEPSLWDGDFYIIYEPESSSVVDLFFSKTPLPVGGNFPAFYEKWRAAPKDARMDSDPMIGYYGGKPAQRGATLSLRTPVINIYNEDTLRAEVTYWVPRTLDMIGGAGDVALNVVLSYQDAALTLDQVDAAFSMEPDISYLAYTYTWTLDSLNGIHFKDLFPASGNTRTYGDDFTLTAEVSYTGELAVNGASKTAQDNSLFAQGSHGETAYIACLRHLQNLDRAFSEVAGKSKAVQQGDIRGVEAYIFQPINNHELQVYDGADFSIADLRIGGSSMPGGLFGVFAGSAGAEKELRSIRLVNTTLLPGSGPAGTLVGNGSHLRITDCQVYWQNRSDQTTNLRDVLGSSAGGLKYQVTSTGPAGGLAGTLHHAQLTRCSASTLVESTGAAAGGLAGSGSELTLTSSYAASYLKGPSGAGLVGDLTGRATLSGSYAVGFIDTSAGPGAAAGGLCLGAGNAVVSNSYSAMLFTAGDSVRNYPLCQNGSYTHTYYLSSDTFHFIGGYEALGKSYSELTNSARWSELFGADTFAAKGAAHSHPYNLQTSLALTSFAYPGLEDLEHWGDWGAQFQNGSLVYYERYEDNTYGFSGGDVSHLSDSLVVEDGYAVAYRGSASISGLGVTLDVIYPRADGIKSEQFSYQKDSIYEVPHVEDTSGEIDSYFLLPLPEAVVNTDYAAGNFYQKITIADEQGQQNYYYNPHFSNTVLPYEKEMDEEAYWQQLARRLQVEVRSPRQLYMLSQFAAYYASSHQYRFLQQLALDYTLYTGYDLFRGNWSQAPIGLNAASPFRGSYYGNTHPITGVQIAAADDAGNPYQYVGLFGYSTSVLRDIVCQMDKSPALTLSQSGSSSKILYAGGLVGYNGGTVDNCAASGVHLQASCYHYSTIYLGGLAGRNEGTINSSAAEVAHLSAEASMSNAYAGGFVGYNAQGGIIRQCYAVGKVSASRARYGTVYACGFAGQNKASITRSYAAVFLMAEGGSEVYGFCPDTSTNCVYLNDGNFTYRDEHYAAQYQDPSAKPVIWADLAYQHSCQAVDALGMEKGAMAFDSQTPYPYPSSVTGKEAAPVHYGQWPEPMKLGPMGAYYWEKLVADDRHATYHFTALSLDGNETLESSTLSTAHGDGGVVTEYGYGYFHRADTVRPDLNTQGIYWDEHAFDPQNETTAQRSNEAADQALFALMNERYIFYSYNTRLPDEGNGLHLTQSGQRDGEPPFGTWTLRQGADTLRIHLDPHFAAALAADGDPLAGTRERPYQVRSAAQFRFMNWHLQHRNTTTVLTKEERWFFPYLSFADGGAFKTRDFYWEQTHDLDGKKGTYTPIAEFYDPTWSNNGGTLYGWFGGSYNGNDYVIADMNITGQVSSCVGLFGAVFDGTLENIVLHSTDGKATILGRNSGTSQWYAVGGLAGLAGSQTNSAVKNCAVTGYTIQDTHKADARGKWGGTGLGGLIGICDMSLSGCTAVTNVIVQLDSKDNVRVGGLVGSCQGSISSCYSGGSIAVSRDSSTPNNRGIYIGGIVGGIYMKPLKVGGSDNITVGRSGQDLQNTLTNCYSYTALPNSGSNQHIKALYAVGGSGELNIDKEHDDPNMISRDHGWTNYHNNYYLAAEVLKNNNGTIGLDRTDIQEDQVVNLTYAQMADNTSDDGLLNRLNANGGGFATVTTQTTSGAPINGRYSFGSDASLLGKDYPFPTILTQTSDVSPGGRANVHYGDWPLAGIRREHGALPVNIDLFANYAEETGNAVWTESLTLSGVDGGGQWRVAQQHPIVQTELLSGTSADSPILKILPQAAGSTVVTVSYTIDGVSYTLPIEVNVTADLRLAASKATAGPIFLFANASVSAPLELRDKNGQALPPSLQEKITLSNPTVEFDPGYFTQTAIEQEGTLSLHATSRAAAGGTQITAGYDFSYLGTPYHATSVLALQVVSPEVTLPALTFVFDQDAQAAQHKEYTGTEGFQITVDGQAQSLSNLHIAAFNEISAEFKSTILVEWARDADGAELPGTLAITAYPQQLYPVSAVVYIQFQFDWAEGSHTMWQDLPVQIELRRPDPPAPSPAGSPNGQEMPEEGQP